MNKCLDFIKQRTRDAVYSFPSSYVLMFHHITESPRIRNSGCILSTEDFKSIVSLNLEYKPISEIVKKPSNGGVALTFDDGLEDLYSIAFPYLRMKGIPFAAFIVTGLLDEPGYITTEQLLEMCSDPLVTIGSHGMTHKVLTKLPLHEAEREVILSKDVLEGITGHEVRYFAYSHGQYNRSILDSARVYKAAFSTAERPYNYVTGFNRLAIPRYNMDSVSLERQMRFFRDLQ